ncbi:MAG TPA: UDP-N-acetylmuramate dehydrogenase [Flavisolibacter sp.]|jgi:UDP-N-acetylmuramate dehydrogenase|nr:UDP-N-acetylmuramate dehydrogenase [Flavisolibacter sp.]
MIEHTISLQPFHTFGIDVKAKAFARFTTIQEMQELLEDPAMLTSAQQLILGGGSNILLTQDFDGFVLKNELPGLQVVGETADHIFVKAGAGVNWHQFVLFCVDNGFAGTENLSLIPGNVGASPMQNIGAYGVEVKDIFHELEAYHIKDKSFEIFDHQACAFGYRESAFKRKWKGQFIITSVTFRLDKKPVYHISYGAIQEKLDEMKISALSIKAISDAVIAIRNSKLPDPKIIGNAGSFFKNPQVTLVKYEELVLSYPRIPAYPVDALHKKVPAGWLIEQCGWKGYRKGDAGCYDKQALVLVNYGKASGAEIYELSEAIIGSVKDTFGIELEREVNVF